MNFNDGLKFVRDEACLAFLGGYKLKVKVPHNTKPPKLGKWKRIKSGIDSDTWEVSPISIIKALDEQGFR